MHNVDSDIFSGESLIQPLTSYVFFSQLQLLEAWISFFPKEKTILSYASFFLIKFL